MTQVYLRDLGPSDARPMAGLLQANRSFLKPWDPDRPEAFYSAEGQLEVIAAGTAERDAGHGCSFGIFEQSSSELVGRIALSSIVRGAWQNANVGYWVAERCNGRGYASEALAGAVAFAFDELQLHRMQAAIMPRNVGSIRVVEKNGFRREGTAERYLLIAGRWEDHLIYALTREERR